MLATTQLVRAGRTGLLPAVTRLGAAINQGPCLACAFRSGRRRLHDSKAGRRQEYNFGGGNRGRPRNDPAERVTGIWERPSEFQQSQKPRPPLPIGEWLERVLQQERAAKEADARRRPHKTPVEAMTGPQAKMAVIAVMLAAVAFYVWNSQTVPLTGRSRFNFLSDDLMEWMQPRAAEGIIKEIQQQGGSILPADDIRTQIVKRVMKRLIPVSGLAHLKWEIYVIDDRKLTCVKRRARREQQRSKTTLTMTDSDTECDGSSRRQGFCIQRAD